MTLRNRFGAIALRLTRHLPHRRITLPYPRNPKIRLSFFPDTELGLWLGFNEPRLLSRWKELIAPGDTVLDVGAHIGVYSLLALQEPATRVHAFEPFPDNVTRLKRHGESNDVGSRLEVIPGAVSDTNGTDTLQVATEGRQHTLRKEANSGQEHISVETLTLDTYCMEEGVRPDVVKIDVEGAAGRVLAGAESTVAAAETTWIVELHGATERTAVRDAFPDSDYERSWVSDRHLVLRPRDTSDASV